MNTRHDTHEHWSMLDERMFIAGLGRWSPFETGRPVDRAALLRGYLEGLELRTAWGTLDREELRVYAEESLANEIVPGGAAAEEWNKDVKRDD